MFFFLLATSNKSAAMSAAPRRVATGHRSPVMSSGRLLDLRHQVALDRFGVEHDLRVVLRGVLQLLEIVQAAVLVDAVDCGDEPHRPARVRVEMLVDGVW